MADIVYTGPLNITTGTISTSLTAWSMSFWFKTTDAGFPLASRMSGSFAARFYVSVNTSGYLSVGSSIEGSGNTSSVVVNDNNWHHVAVTGNNFYLDGSLVGTFSYTAATYDVARWYVRYFNSSQVMKSASMDETVVSAPLNATQIQQQYSFKPPVRVIAPAPETLSLYGTTANGVSNKTAVVQTFVPPTLGLNATYNNNVRIGKKVTLPAASMSLSAVAANITAVRKYAQTAAPATMSLSATQGGRAYSPNKVITLPAFDMFLQGTDNNRAFTPSNGRVVAPVATMSMSALPANVTLRTNRTIKQEGAGVVNFRAINPTKPVPEFNNDNRWYKAIREIYPYFVKTDPYVGPGYNLGTTAWFTFEGTTPPSEPSIPAGPTFGSAVYDNTTGPVKANGTYTMGVDAGHGRSGIKFTNDGYFQTKRTYPWTIYGAQQGLPGGLRTHYTAEFAFKADAPGPLYNGARINANGRLEVPISSNELGLYWYELRTDYPNLLDGNWHHMVLISPRDDYFVAPNANRERHYIMIDGKVASAVHSPGYVPNLWGYDEFGFASNPSIAFDDIIISMFRIISTAEAQRLYYEWSDAVITRVPSMKISLDATKNHRPKGNVKRMLVFYGSPKGRRNSFENDQIATHVNSWSRFSLNDHPDKTTGKAYPGAATTFRWNEYLCFPVSYTGGNASADGILNKQRASYVDDYTGYTRLVDLENDFAVDPKDFDAVTFIRFPQMSDRYVTLPSTGGPRFDDQSSSSIYKYATSPANEANDMLVARQKTINKFRDQVMELVYNGVSLIIQDPDTAKGMGLISNYDDIDQMGEPSEEYLVYNLGARATDAKYGRSTPRRGTFGSPGYFDEGHNNWKRRITAVLPGYSDVDSYYVIDKVHFMDSNPFLKHSDQRAYQYKFFDNLAIGDEIASDTVTTGGDIAQRFVSGLFGAKPQQILVPAVILAQGQNKVSLKDGTYIDNPNKDYVFSFAVPEGTGINGRITKGRIFVEMSEGYSYDTRLTANDPNYDDGTPISSPRSTWSYDSTRENQIVAYYMLEKFRNGVYIGQESVTGIVYGDGVPLIFFNRVDFISRGAKWVAQLEAEDPSNATVRLPAATMGMGAVPVKSVKAQRNTVVRSDVGRMRLEMKFVKNINQPDVKQTAFPPVLSLRAIDTSTTVKLPPFVMNITGGDGVVISDRTPDFVFYYEVFAPTLYLEEN